MTHRPAPDPAEPYENRSDEPLAPSTKTDQDMSPAGDRGDGARRHREQSEAVSGVPNGEDEDADPVG